MYDESKINFKKVSLLADHVYALTENGEIYGWGSNEYSRLGNEIADLKVYQPTLLPYFNEKDKFKILDFVCGDDHSFIHVEEFENKKSIGFKLFQIGYDPSWPFI